MKPKVAIIVSHPIQHFCPQYASYALNDKWQTKVFFASAIGYKPYYDPDFKKTIAWDNIDVSIFDHEFLNGDELVPINKHIKAKNLNEALTAYAPDVIITYGYFQVLQRDAVKWARKNKKKLLFISDAELLENRGGIKKLLKEILVRWYFSRIDGFLTVGNNNEAYYKYYGAKENKLFRMHFPIDIEEYKAKYKDRDTLNIEYRKRHEVDISATVLCTTGKLISIKRQEDIIAALAILEKMHLYFSLLIIGDGPDMNMLVDKAKILSKSEVIFTGFKGVNDLPGYVAMTDIYIQSSDIDRHSLSVSEAIYMGKPIILSDKCGSWGESDDVIPEKNGIVYVARDINALAYAIQTLSINKNQMKYFGELSHKLAVKYQERAHGEGLLNALMGLGLLHA
jgi:glycosyltransferase involved in cell wall biosynthesis